MLDVIQGLWIGDGLSVMERLSITSFLANGHDFHLYVYADVGNLPAGAVLKDGNDILPASSIFQYNHYKSYAGFANYFRYKLLRDKGGWWTDLDVVCLKPFAFEQAYIFSSEYDPHVGEIVNAGIIRTPKQSPFASYAWATCKNKDPSCLAWGETGPKLVSDTVDRFSLQAYVKTAVTFCPVPPSHWWTVIHPGVRWNLGDATYAVHLWHELWRRNGCDKNREYDSRCLYERLKARYVVHTLSA